LQVTVGEVEPEKTAQRSPAAPADKPQASNAGQFLGLTVSELTEAQRQEWKLRGGVRVEAVTEPATRAGLSEGDVILAVANTEIKNVKEFEAVLARLDKTKPVAILLRRGEWAQYTLIRPQK
jgi:serine protease Do